MEVIAFAAFLRATHKADCVPEKQSGFARIAFLIIRLRLRGRGGDKRNDERVGLGVDIFVRDDFEAVCNHAAKRF
ncbi:MAG: hypothetical protein GC190_19140 [Alphaproteobacteria bacterium]|nr:hypothetical protein [Alphaproteobacteria bacterium]